MSQPATSSGLKSADATICTGPGKLRGVQLLGDGTNAASVVIYDGTSAAGTVIAKISLDAGLTEAGASGIPDCGVWANTGIHADVTGTGAEYIVYFDKN